MSFVLDNSVTMRWLFGDGKPEALDYAVSVLDAMKETRAVVPSIWGLEVANVIAKAEAKSWISEARSEVFLEMLQTLTSKSMPTHLSMHCLTPFNWRVNTNYLLMMQLILSWLCAKTYRLRHSMKIYKKQHVKLGLNNLFEIRTQIHSILSP